MPTLATNWKGTLTGSTHTCADANRLLERKAKKIKIATGKGSDYRSRFFQGATFTPRRLLLVAEVKGKTAIGPGLKRLDVRSRITSLDKEPWSDIAPLTGTIEDQFIAKVYLGEHALPFRLLEPELGVIPLVNGRLVDPDSSELDAFDGIRNWWTTASDVWTKHRKAKSPQTLAERLDYHGGLIRQVSPAQVRVVYSTSGKNLTAAIVRDPEAFIDHKLYWTQVDSEEEARYLVAILNSESIQKQVAEYQSVGAFGPRDFHKHVFEVPFPIYDSNNKLHKKLANAGRTAETIAASVNIAGMGFKKARSQIRSRISATVGIPIEAFVADLL